MGTQVRSFCKINLGLAVGPVRQDGFHGLTTCYQTLALHDLVTVSAERAKRTEITLETDHPGVPCTARGDCDRNTAYKMVLGALQALGIRAKVHLLLQKRLPVQGGLGAGSANAAAALLGLERELGVALAGPERLQLAATVGSDVPLFLLGGTVLGLERGEAVFPLPDAEPLMVVVAVPEVGVSTAQAFQELDRQMAAGEQHATASGLTPTSAPGRLEQLSRVMASVWSATGVRRETTGIAHSSSSSPAGREDLPQGRGIREGGFGSKGDLAENPLLELVQTGVENDFESVAFGQHPSLLEIKRALQGSEIGVSAAGPDAPLYASLSGSGSALFGIYGSAQAAREAQHRVQALGTRAFLTETLSRHEYWQRMFA